MTAPNPERPVGFRAMPISRTRGPYAKTRRRREEILDAALDVFAAGGYRGSSLRDVAERVGISHAGLLHHFSSKAELLSEVLTRRDNSASEEIGLVPGNVNGEQFLRNYAALIERNESTRGLAELYCLLSAEATTVDHPAHDYFVGRYEYVVGLLRDAFSDLAAQGQLRPGIEPDTAAVDLVAITDGIQLQWLLRPNATPMGATIRRYLASVTTLEF